MDPALQELMSGDDDELIEAIIKLRNRNEVPESVRLVATFADVSTCRLRRDAIHDVWKDDRVLSLKAPRLIDAGSESTSDSLDQEATHSLAIGPTDIRRPVDIVQNGTGTVLGVIDFGCDFAHPNLLDESGNTRLLALWDQRGGALPNSPQPYGYGTVFQHSDIDLALTNDDPYAALKYHPADADPYQNGSHGMHVMDIAAGNGRAIDSPSGIAPAAELVFVHLSAGGLSGLSDLGDSVRILEALDYIHTIAGDRPCVINTSLGRHAGIHNGKTLVEQGIDALLTENTGRLVVQSCGNYYQAQAHASGRLSPGGERTMTWNTHHADVTPNEFEVWYQGQDRFGIELQAPDNGPAFSTALGDASIINIDGVEIGKIYHRAFDPAAGDHHINIFLRPDAPAGAWRIVLKGEEVVDGRYHAWVERDAACRGCQSRFSREDADPESTTGTICNGFYPIAVGAYDAHDDFWPLVAASSSGPTRDGRIKPDLLAPGGSVLAARSHARDGESVAMNTRKSGTSMAAPHVAGTALLMFEAAGRPMSITETRRALLGSLDEIQIEPEQQHRVGGGYLNITRAVEAAIQLGSKQGGSMEAFIEQSDNVDETVKVDTPQPSSINQKSCQCTKAVNFVEAEVLPQTENSMMDVETLMQILAQLSSDNMSPTQFESVDTVNDHREVDLQQETDTWEAMEAVQVGEDNIDFNENLTDIFQPQVAATESAELSDPEVLFDQIQNDASVAESILSETGMDIIASPGSWLEQELQAGDLLVTRALGEGAIVSVTEIAVTPAVGSDIVDLHRPGYKGKRQWRLRRHGSKRRVPLNSLLLRHRRRTLVRPQSYPSTDSMTIQIPDSSTSGSTYSEAGPRKQFRASRFAADPTLDAVLNNEQFLRHGSKGAAVNKIQQALLDLGFSLPRFGADGDYGSETAAAVHEFQVDQRRFKPTMGLDSIVGHETMERLDIAFGIRTRMNVLLMSSREKIRLTRAILELRRRGIYHRFVRDHANSMPTAHRQPAFLPWHRQFILNYETELRTIDSAIALPYWDWAADPGVDSAGRPMWNSVMQSLMGGNGSGSNQAVTSGPFAGWRSIDSAGADTALPLARDFAAASWATNLPSIAEVTAVLGITPYDQTPWDDAASTDGFRNELEGWANGNSLHNVVHGWVGGSMLPGTSPNDPCFFLHHSFVDKIWFDWQTRFPGLSYLPLTRQTRSGLSDAFGLNDDVPVANVTSGSPITFKPSETISLTTLKDHQGNKGIEVNYV